mmetsp:Transcript_51060/g.165267  ORF Transcript_51060/g.165267 Transcript_51060/m.165267 type:complete len:109 (+) Transcript_51060:67-393(+)
MLARAVIAQQALVLDLATAQRACENSEVARHESIACDVEPHSCESAGTQLLLLVVSVGMAVGLVGTAMLGLGGSGLPPPACLSSTSLKRPNKNHQLCVSSPCHAGMCA